MFFKLPLQADTTYSFKFEMHLSKINVSKIVKFSNPHKNEHFIKINYFSLTPTLIYYA